MSEKKNIMIVKGDSMPEKNVHLSMNDIVEKEFKRSMRGYNEEEVDEFLDIVIRDYEVYIQEIRKLRQENERLKRNVNSSTTRTQAVPQQANYDVLKRLSNLEKAVFGQKNNE